MFTEKEMAQIIQKASEQVENDLDLSLALSELRTSAEKLYYLLKYPSLRVLQPKLVYLRELVLQN